MRETHPKRARRFVRAIADCRCFLCRCFLLALHSSFLPAPFWTWSTGSPTRWVPQSDPLRHALARGPWDAPRSVEESARWHRRGARRVHEGQDSGVSSHSGATGRSTGRFKAPNHHLGGDLGNEPLGISFSRAMCKLGED